MRRRLSLTMITGLLAFAAVTMPRFTPAKSITLPPDNAMARLKPGPGVEVVQTQCSICHSTDYIVRQPGGDAAHWAPEVKKMITAFGAPLSDADAKIIVRYLATEYGASAAPTTSKSHASAPKGK